MTGIGVIVVAGSVCGVRDLISASALFRLKGGTFERLLQFIASGAFGESAFKGGKRSAGVGFLFHFFIAFTAAAVYYATSRRMTFFVSHPFPYSIVYRVLIHLFISFIVIHPSQSPNRKFSPSSFLVPLVY